MVPTPKQIEKIHEKLNHISGPAYTLFNASRSYRNKVGAMLIGTSSEGLVYNHPKFGGAFGTDTHSEKVRKVAQEYLKKLEEKDKSNLFPFGRTFFHLSRLTAERILDYMDTLTDKSRSSEEKKFGFDFLKHAGFSKEQYPARIFLDSEGRAVFIWWTLAPYLHNEFVRKGLSPKQSLKVLIDWANYTKKRDNYNWDLPGVPMNLERPLSSLDSELGHKQARAFAEKFADEFIKVFHKK
ncbi:MAG: hypothetical protein ABH803_04030 [Candidatus Micrarchaeota archaeon]